MRGTHTKVLKVKKRLRKWLRGWFFFLFQITKQGKRKKKT